MIVSLSPPGVKCQVGDFVMLVDPSAQKKGNLILRTKTELPIGFPLAPEVVLGAGEYEISGVRVKGVGLEKESSKEFLRTVYSAELEGIRLAFLGELAEEVMSDALDKLGTVDILFLSAPGKRAKQLTTLIKQLDPRIIIPIDDASAKLLAEELGQKVEAHEKLVIKKKDLDKEEIVGKLVWLKN